MRTAVGRLPEDLREFEIILIDPMLATGGSTVAALDLLVAHKARHDRLVNLVAAPEGIRHVRAYHPRVPLFTAAIDNDFDFRVNFPHKGNVPASRLSGGQKVALSRRMGQRWRLSAFGIVR